LAEPAVALELLLPLVRAGGVAVVMTGGADQAGAEVGTVKEPGFRGGGPPGPAEARRASRAAIDGAESAESASSGRGGGRERASAVGRAAELLGAGRPRWRRFAVPGVEEPRWVIIVPKLRDTPREYPRRAGVPQRRPLGY
jgi:hypothetical protein